MGPAVSRPHSSSPRGVPQDPVVSRSVALAEAPGTGALVLGSGVSRDAGVPTGFEVMARPKRNPVIPDVTSEPAAIELLERRSSTPTSQKQGIEHLDNEATEQKRRRLNCLRKTTE